MNCNIVMLRDSRYDAVLHLVTAADGAQNFYASLNNEARYESIDEAIEKDKKLRLAYMGHQRWVFISNGFNDFNQKINSAKQNVHFLLGHKAGN